MSKNENMLDNQGDNSENQIPASSKSIENIDVTEKQAAKATVEPEETDFIIEEVHKENKQSGENATAADTEKISLEASGKTLSEVSEETSAKASENTSSETSEYTSSETSENTSSEASENTSSEASENTSSETSENISTEASENTSSEASENTSSEASEKISPVVTEGTVLKPKKKFDLFSMIRLICFIGFLIFTGLFINEVFIQPYRAEKATELTRELYNPSITPAPTQAPVLTPAASVTGVVPTTDPTRDSKGRMLSFKDLLDKNEDTKGWITIPETNIDYVVLQNSSDPEYYLTHDFNKEIQKAGCLFLDSHSSVEDNTKNLVIHGHNMKSTNSMFHHLVKFKKLDFYKKSPVFNFNTIYQNGQWKIFSVFITNGTSDKEPFFDYTKSTFQDSSDFMNFVYQLRIRSIFNLDTVDVNEDDQIVCLSTCSYEISNYRTVVVARRVRDGEDPTVDVDSVTRNKKALYPETYYKNYGGEAPKYPKTFEKALEKGMIKWYTPAK